MEKIAEVLRDHDGSRVVLRVCGVVLVVMGTPNFEEDIHEPLWTRQKMKEVRDQINQAVEEAHAVSDV